MAEKSSPQPEALFDDELPLYRRLAEFIYSLGWRPACDAQYDNLRDNLHMFVELLNPVAYRKLRDEFAGQAMHALLTEDGTTHFDQRAKEAYDMADAMLKARTA